jgi:CRISPR/Cas system-associated endoribonuclease Cas2
MRSLRRRRRPVRREEAIQYLEELIKAEPGHRADFYLSRAAAETGMRKKTLSEYLKILHESGRIQLHNDRFYPAGMPFEQVMSLEQKLLSWLDSKIGAVSPVTPPQDDQNAYYLVVYDIKENIGAGKRRAIYRKLLKIQEEILKNGGEVERLQMSVWRVKGRQNALLLASAVPEECSRLRIIKIASEIKKE